MGCVWGSRVRPQCVSASPPQGSRCSAHPKRSGTFSEPSGAMARRRSRRWLQAWTLWSGTESEPESSTRSSILRPEQRLDHELLLAVLDLALEQGEDLVLTFEDLDRLSGQRVDGVQCFVVGFCAGIACGRRDVLAHHDGDHCQGLKYATDDQQHDGERVVVGAAW